MCVDEHEPRSGGPSHRGRIARSREALLRRLPTVGLAWRASPTPGAHLDPSSTWAAATPSSWSSFGRLEPSQVGTSAQTARLQRETGHRLRRLQRPGRQPGRQSLRCPCRWTGTLTALGSSLPLAEQHPESGRPACPRGPLRLGLYFGICQRAPALPSPFPRRRATLNSRWRRPCSRVNLRSRTVLGVTSTHSSAAMNSSDCSSES